MVCLLHERGEWAVGQVRLRGPSRYVTFLGTEWAARFMLCRLYHVEQGSDGVGIE
jgi:hypothetical protein